MRYSWCIFFGSFILACVFYPSSCYRFAVSVNLGKLASGFHCIMAKLSGMYCLDNSHRLKTKIHILIYIYIYIYLYPIVLIETSLQFCGTAFVNKQFFRSGVEVRLQALNDRVELLERKNSAISGSPRSWWRRILLRLQGSSASTSTRN